MRFFNQAQKRAMYNAAGGFCETCGVEIDSDNFEGGHGIAAAKGGTTTIPNSKAQCADCNRAEGINSQPLNRKAKPLPKLRITAPYQPLKWQADFADVVKQAIAAGKKGVAADIITGAGKTYGALWAYGTEIAPRYKRPLILVFAPYVNIQRGWVQTARPMGINLTEGTDIDFVRRAERGEVHGAAVTYAWLTNNAYYLQALAHRFDLTIIRDEAEWLAEENSWGALFAEYSADSKFQIGMSSTLFRTDPREMMVGFDMEDGEVLADFVYGYVEGLRDKVNPRLHYAAYDDTIRWTMAKGDETQNFNLKFTEGNERNANGSFCHLDIIGQRLSAAVSFVGPNPFATSMLDIAVAELASKKATHPQAAGIIIASNITNAEAIESALREKGQTAIMVASNRPGSTRAIEEFKLGGADWIVAVDMCSIGTDIPRARVLLYLSNTVAERRFRQIVGRLLRLDRSLPWDAQDCVILTPADPRIEEMLGRICEPVPPREIPRDPTGGGGGGDGRRQLLSVDADGSEVHILGSVGEGVAPLKSDAMRVAVSFYQNLFSIHAKNFDWNAAPVGVTLALTSILAELKVSKDLANCDLPGYLAIRADVERRLAGIGLDAVDAPCVACALLRTVEHARELVKTRTFGFRGAW